MNFYQEITFLPQMDISHYFVWQKLYQQIHLALVENKVDDHSTAIGVSFPEYDVGQYLLGTKLRLFAMEKTVLEQLGCEKWLSRLKDYLQCGEISPVPEAVAGHANFRQVKPKGSKEKLARRWSKRKGEPFEKALAHYENYNEQRCRLPYINMISQSNGQHFRIFIKKQEMKLPQPGLFSCYGLSNITTVPLF